MYNDKDFVKIRDIILKNIPCVKKIILFGSYSGGVPTEDSDMDFIILTSEQIDRKQKLSFLTQIRWESALAGYKTDFLLKNYNEFNRDKKKLTLSNIIFKQGKVLWKAKEKNMKNGLLKQNLI